MVRKALGTIESANILNGTRLLTTYSWPKIARSGLLKTIANTEKPKAIVSPSFNDCLAKAVTVAGRLDPSARKDLETAPTKDSRPLVIVQATKKNPLVPGPNKLVTSIKISLAGARMN